MAIVIYVPSADWPSYYNANMGALDTVDSDELDQVTLAVDPPYDNDMLRWNASGGHWENYSPLSPTPDSKYAFWDPTCKDSGISLSRDNRVAYEDSNYHMVRTTLGSNTVSKFYVEIENYNCKIRCNSTYHRCGVGYITNCADPINNHQKWYYRGDGVLYDNTDTSVDGNVENLGQGEYFGFAVEVSGGTCNVWVRQPSGSWASGDPETGTDPSFSFSTGGNEIFVFGIPSWLSLIDLKVRESDMLFGIPNGFSELVEPPTTTTVTQTTTTTTALPTTTTTALPTTTTTTVLGTTTTTAAPTTTTTLVYANSITFSIDSSKIDDTLENFPVRLYMTDGTATNEIDFSAVFTELGDTDRKKISVMAGATECYVEIVYWDATSEKAILEIKVPSISDSADTELTLYYDSTMPENTSYIGDTGSTPAQTVWDSDFIAVYHLVSDPSLGIPDATANGRDLTAYGSMGSGDVVSLDIGIKGIDFDGVDDYLNYVEGSAFVTATPVTLEVYGYTPSTMSNYVSPAIALSDPNKTSDRMVLYGREYDALAWIYTPSSYNAYADGTLVASTYYQFAFRYASNGYRTAYLNGVPGTVETGASDWPSDMEQITLGDSAPGSSHSPREGVIIEGRISSIDRGAAYIKATNESIADTLIATVATTTTTALPTTTTTTTVLGTTTTTAAPTTTTTVEFSCDTQIMSATQDDDIGWYQATWRTMIPAARISASSTKIRLLITAPATGNTNVQEMWCGEDDGGVGQSFVDGEQRQVYVGGNASFSIPAGTSVWSDEIEVVINSSAGFLISAYAQSSAGQMGRETGVTGAGIWYQSGNNAGTTYFSGGSYSSTSLGFVTAICDVS